MDSLIPAEAYRVTFAHKGSDWSYDFIEPSGLSGHRFVLSPSIPWLWWILNFILLSLLLWCLFGSACWCNLFSASPNSIHNDEEHYYGEAIPCNAQVASGGAGVTENIHEQGTSTLQEKQAEIESLPMTQEFPLIARCELLDLVLHHWSIQWTVAYSLFFFAMLLL